MQEDTDISGNTASNESGNSTGKGVAGRLFSSRKLLLAGGMATILVIVILGAWFFFAGNDKEKTEVRATETRNEDGIKREFSEVQDVFEDVVALAPFEMVRLKAGSSMKYVDMHIALETSDPALVPEVNEETARIRHIVKAAAGEMTWFELRNPQGKIRMKYELIKRINSLFPRVVIRNLYFTYFIMQ